MDRTLSGATTPGQSGPGSDGNEGVLSIPQSSKTGASPSDCLVPYPGQLSGWCRNPLLRYSRCILQPQSTGVCSHAIYIYIYIYNAMEFRLRPLSFMEFFYKTTIIRHMIAVCIKSSTKPRGRSLNSMALNIYIKYIFIYYYIIALSWILNTLHIIFHLVRHKLT